MELPTEPIKPTNYDPRSMLIYASPKLGKTTILSSLRSNLLIDLEGGSEFVTALKKEVSNLGELNELGKAVIENGRPYDYVSVDTVTKLEEWCLENADKKYRKTPQGKNFKGSTIIELEYGLGYGLLREEFKRWFNKFKKLADTVIYVAHVKDKMIGKEGEEVAAKDINLTGQLKAMVASDVDAVSYMYVDPEDPSQRKLTFITSVGDITCGNRCPHLEGKEFVISKKLEDGTVETYWDKIFKGKSVTV